MCQISAKILKKARHRVRDPNHSCPQATKTDEVASTSAKRPVLDQVSRDYVPISTSPKKQKVLTRHQKEVKEKKRKERDVPMMYNSLDMNSQEPFAFSQVNSLMINKSFFSGTYSAQYDTDFSCSAKPISGLEKSGCG